MKSIKIKVLSNEEEGKILNEFEVEFEQNLKQFKHIIKEKARIYIESPILLYYKDKKGEDNYILDEENYISAKNTIINAIYVNQDSKNENKVENSLSFFDEFEIVKNNEEKRTIKDLFLCSLCYRRIKSHKSCPHCKKIVCLDCMSKLSTSRTLTIKCPYCRDIFPISEWKPIPGLDELFSFIPEVTKKYKETKEGFLKKLCPFHPEQKLEYYCHDCNKILCGECMSSEERGTHINHKLMSYEIYHRLNERKKEIEKYLLNYILINNQYNKDIEEVEKEYNDLINFCNKLIKGINEKKELILNQIKEENNKLNGKIINLKTYLKTLNNIFNGLSYNYIENNYNKDIKFILDLKNFNLDQNYSLFYKKIEQTTVEDESIGENTKKTLNFVNYVYTINSILENSKIYILTFGNSNEEEIRYNGYFNRRGKKEGKGKVIISNGDEYDGNWEDNKEDGYGIYEWKEGGKYKGNFSSNYFNGYGIRFYKDGSIYKGMWKDNKRHGAGVIIYSNGVKTLVNYKHGELINQFSFND